MRSRWHAKLIVPIKHTKFDHLPLRFRFRGSRTGTKIRFLNTINQMEIFKDTVHQHHASPEKLVLLLNTPPQSGRGKFKAKKKPFMYLMRRYLLTWWLLGGIWRNFVLTNTDLWSNSIVTRQTGFIISTYPYHRPTQRVKSYLYIREDLILKYLNIFQLIQYKKWLIDNGLVKCLP